MNNGNRGKHRFESVPDTQQVALLSRELLRVNTELAIPLSSPEFQSQFPGQNVFADPASDGTPRILWTGMTGITFRATLAPHYRCHPHTLLQADSTFQPITVSDIAKLEFLRPRSGASAESARGCLGPYPYTTWMTTAHYDALMSLVAEAPLEGVAIETDPAWPHWVFVKLPWPGHPGLALVFVAPLTDGPWGRAEKAGFAYAVKPDGSSSNQREKWPTDPPDLAPILNGRGGVQ